jgi:hypothetical protein
MSMFQYTHEMILNSLVAEDGTDKARVVVLPASANSVSTNHLKLRDDMELVKDEKAVSIQRFGEYKVRNILGQKVFKTPGIRGKKSVMTIDCDGLIAKDEAGVYEAGLYNFTFSIKMPNRFYGEYAHPAFLGFFKPVMIGFEVTASVAADGEKLANLLANDLKLVIPENNKFILVKVDGSKVVLTIPDVYGHFGEYRFERYDSTLCDSCLGDYFKKDVDDKITIEDGVEPFATGQWLIENLRFPSYPNIRYAAINEDEYPLAGSLYTEYTFTYCANRIGFGGMSGVGQEVAASTKHVLYVENSLVDDFDAVLEEAGLELVEPESKSDDKKDDTTTKKVVTINAATLSLANGSVQLVADESPVLDGAKFTWTLVSGNAEVTEDGILRPNKLTAVGDVISVKASLEGYEDGVCNIEVVA